mmetsp:Transcript_100316/g.279272  ORF Transcript_100316/g.279272 Transcript_100316/m.279272 type:complete len:521 (+) Transcript_100316:2515-4077(+)
MLQAHGHLALGLAAAAGDRVHGIQQHLGAGLHHRFDGLQGRVHRPIAVALGAVFLVADGEHDGRVWAFTGLAALGQRQQSVMLRIIDDRLVHHKGQDVLVEDLILAVGEILEALEGRIDLGLAFQLDAQLLQPLLEGVAARQLAEHDLVGGPAHVLGAHDLVGVARFQHTVLVDAAGMRKGVGANDGLVGLHNEARGLRDELGGRHDLRSVDADIQPEIVAPRAHGHHDFFERAVASPLAQAVDRAFDLPGAADLHAGQRIGHRHAQVVVAVHAPDRLVAVGHLLAQAADEVAVELGDGVADGVGNVDRAGPFPDDGLTDAGQEVDVGAVTVLGRELDVAAQLAREAHGQRRLLQHLLARHAQLLLHVQFASGNEGVDARSRGAGQGFSRARDVAVIGAGQRADRAVLDGRRDRLHRLEVAVAGRRKACLDDVDPHALQLAGDAQLFLARHRRAGRLLAVAQRGVEDDQLVGHRTFSSWCWGTVSCARDRPDSTACIDARTMLPSMPTPWRVWSPTRISR